jgi:hypothetical protein
LTYRARPGLTVALAPVRGPFAQPRAFLDDVLRRLEDLDLHLLPTEQPLELANPLLGPAQGARWDHILVRGHRRGGPASTRRFHSPIGVFFPFTNCWTIPRLNSTVKIRRPSDFRATSPMGPLPPAEAG